MAVKADTKPSGKAARFREIADPSSKVLKFGNDNPLKLDAGVDLAPFQIAYQSYGTLNGDKSNAILVCHALTGDQHVANVHPVTGKPGWWDDPRSAPAASSTPTAISSSAPMSSAAAWARPGPVEPQTRRRARHYGAHLPGDHHRRHGAGAVDAG